MQKKRAEGGQWFWNDQAQVHNGRFRCALMKQASQSITCGSISSESENEKESQGHTFDQIGQAQTALALGSKSLPWASVRNAPLGGARRQVTARRHRFRVISCSDSKFVPRFNSTPTLPGIVHVLFNRGLKLPPNKP